MLKRLLPHIAAIFTFALLTYVYFLPLHQDMSLNQGDVTQWEGMSKEIVDWNKNHPSDPALWTDGMFGGMPAVQISLTFTGNFVSKIFNALGSVFPSASAYMFMMFLGFYILLLCLDVDPWLSMAGALAYGLSSFIMVSIVAGHNTKVQAISLMAPVIGGVILAYRKNILLGAAITALFLSMAIDSNHLQVAYYILMILGVIGIYYLIISVLEKRIAHFAKATGALIIAGTLALLPNVANLWSTQEYAKETIRGGSSELTQKKQETNGGLDFEYATRWSYGLMDGEMLSILIPDIKGGGSDNTGDFGSDNSSVQKLSQGGNYPIEQVKRYLASIMYWGNQPFTAGTVYFGAALVLLFVFALLIYPNKLKWALLTLSILSVLLAAGHNTPFFKLLFNYLPFFNKFRTPAMALVIAEITMPLLALLGLNELLADNVNKDEAIKKLKIALGITGGIVILFGLLGSYFYSYSGPADLELGKNSGEMLGLIRSERASMLRMDSFRSLFFIIAAGAVVWFFVQKKLSKQLFVGAITVLVLLDGWMVAKRYLNSDDFVESSRYQANHTETQADRDILDHDPPSEHNHYRVFNVTRDPFNDAMTSYYHESVGGYHAAKLIRYQDLIENQISKNNIDVLRMLNTRYVIVQNQQTKEPMAQRLPATGDQAPCGNAWFVKEIKWVKNADEEIAALTKFNPANMVVIDERFKRLVPDNSIGSDSAPMVRLNEFTPNKVSYFSNSSSSQLAVFSEIYYDQEKGWHAYLDGKPVEHFRADYVLRAMVIPAGTHQIEFKFEPKSIVTGNKIAYAGSILLFLFAFGAFGLAGYKKYKEIEAEPKPEPKPTPAPVSKSNKKK